MKRKIRKILPRLILALSVVLVATSVVTTVFAKQRDGQEGDDVICDGVEIGEMDVSGMTEAEAAEAVEDLSARFQEMPVTILVGEEEVPATLGDLGYRWDGEDAVESAMQFGKSGNFIKRYKEVKDLENNGMDIPLEPVLDEDALREFVEEKCAAFDEEAQDAELSYENGSFSIKEQKSGREVSVEDTVEQIKSSLASLDAGAAAEDPSAEPLTVEAVVTEVEPERTTEMASLCKDVLGTFSTTYASSSASRANNLANGARLLNGSILWPGEVFSTGENLNPITAENGYTMAGAYQNGQVVDSIGGGVCQVATTLYNAVLLSELEVVERSNHSMIVNYVEPSMDAAIAGNVKDLKFKNTTDAPICIAARTEGRTITFTIYGHETRDLEHREVKYESEVLEIISPGPDKIVKNPSLPEGYRSVTQSAHQGYTAKLWKVVYMDGVEVSREQVNYSSYSAEPAYVTVGTKPKEEEKEEEPEEKDEEKDKDKDKEKDKEKEKDKDKDKATSKGGQDAALSEEPDASETESQEPQESEEPDGDLEAPAEDAESEELAEELETEPETAEDAAQ